MFRYVSRSRDRGRGNSWLFIVRVKPAEEHEVRWTRISSSNQPIICHLVQINQSSTSLFKSTNHPPSSSNQPIIHHLLQINLSSAIFFKSTNHPPSSSNQPIIHHLLQINLSSAILFKSTNHPPSDSNQPIICHLIQINQSSTIWFKSTNHLLSCNICEYSTNKVFEPELFVVHVIRLN